MQRAACNVFSIPGAPKGRKGRSDYRAGRRFLARRVRTLKEREVPGANEETNDHTRRWAEGGANNIHMSNYVLTCAFYGRILCSLCILCSPNGVYTEGVLAELRVSEGRLAASGLRGHAKCCSNHWFYNIFGKKVAVARERCSVAPRRCSHSSFFFANPYKTYEISTFF